MARQFGLLALGRQLRLNNHGLLILCYHGVSRSDEHRWRPSLYVSPVAFRRRMEIIRRCGVQVVPLDSALKQICNGGFSSPSLALTFDDGWQDFHSVVWPILRDCGFPATVYQTSFYSAYNRPVFDTAVSYLLWKGRRRSLRLGNLSGMSGTFELDSETSTEKATDAVLARTARLRLNAEEKDQALQQIAEMVGIDYQQFLTSRTLHLMNSSEIAEVSEDGADVQLHTHRHDVPFTREELLEEIAINRAWVEAITGKPANHFCYPNGNHRPEVENWLRDANISSATTCDPGIVSEKTGKFRLPRLSDSSRVSEAQFEAWISGIGLIASACRRVFLDRDPVAEEPDTLTENMRQSPSAAKSGI